MNGKILSILCLVAMAAIAADAYVIKVWVQSLEDRFQFHPFDVEDGKDNCEKLVLNFLDKFGLGQDISKYPDLRLTNGLGKEYKLDKNIGASGIKHDQTVYIQLHGGPIMGALKHVGQTLAY